MSLPLVFRNELLDRPLKRVGRRTTGADDDGFPDDVQVVHVMRGSFFGLAPDAAHVTAVVLQCAEVEHDLVTMEMMNVRKSIRAARTHVQFDSGGLACVAAVVLSSLMSCFGGCWCWQTLAERSNTQTIISVCASQRQEERTSCWNVLTIPVFHLMTDPVDKGCCSVRHGHRLRIHCIILEYEMMLRVNVSVVVIGIKIQHTA
jgi:hypothetical protein